MADYVDKQQVAANEYNAGSKLGSISLLQPTGFKLIIDRKSYPHLEFFAQSVLHPSLTVTGAELPFRQVERVPYAGDTLSYGELTANIIIDEEMNSYVEMYNWLNRIVRNNYVNAADLSSDDQLSHESDIVVMMQNSHNNTIRTIKYFNCVPTFVGDVSMEATAQPTTPIIFPASWSFTHFEL